MWARSSLWVYFLSLCTIEGKPHTEIIALHSLTTDRAAAIQGLYTVLAVGFIEVALSGHCPHCSTIVLLWGLRGCGTEAGALVVHTGIG